MSFKSKIISIIVVLAISLGLIAPTVALAQSSLDSWDSTTSYSDYSDSYYDESNLTDEEAAALGTTMIVLYCGLMCVAIVMYVIMAIALTNAAKKVGITENLWMAWIPYANIYLMTKIANLEVLQMVLSIFVPFWAYYVLAKVFERRGMSPWTVLYMFIPFVGAFIMLYMLGWKETNNQVTPQIV